MSFFDLLWMFFIIASIQPVLRQKMLEAARTRLLHQLEQKRRSRVIALIHRQETMSLLGFPIFRYIDIEDSEAVLRAIRLTDPSMPIDIILHTPGGLVLAAEQIACALCRHPAKVTVFVPHYAMSGGTLIALAADEIVMDENAVLGPVDPQLGEMPAASIVKVLEQKPLASIDDETLILADTARKALAQVKHTVRELLLKHKQQPQEAERLAEILAGGTWTHDYPIAVEEAKALGLPVTTGIPEEVYQLMDLYPQTTQRRPSVQYIPLPYEPPQRDRGVVDGIAHDQAEPVIRFHLEADGAGRVPRQIDDAASGHDLVPFSDLDRLEEVENGPRPSRRRPVVRVRPVRIAQFPLMDEQRSRIEEVAVLHMVPVGVREHLIVDVRGCEPARLELGEQVRSAAHVRAVEQDPSLPFDEEYAAEADDPDVRSDAISLHEHVDSWHGTLLLARW